MAAFVYSTQFAALTSAVAGPTVIYTVPTGMTAVIRDISGIASGAAAACALAIDSGPVFASLAGAASLDPLLWRGRTVLKAGQTLDLYVLSGTVQLAVSGYLLDG